MSAQDPKANNPKIEQAAASDQNIQKVHAILLREKPEPAEGYSPMPLFLLGFVSAMIFIVSVYFVHNRGGIGPSLKSGVSGLTFKEAALVYDERYDPATAPGAGAVKELTPEQVLASGKKLYATCATCHQPTGTGLAGTYPPLAKSEWVLGSEDRLIRILLNGLKGEITVEGNKYNGLMPAFGKVPNSGYNWTDDKIAHVLTFIRHEWGNAAAPITTAKVKEIREQVAAARPGNWTEAELLAVP
ncbi:cytochrome C [Nibricoccus aquaticus]|uniref:Cytochrome C n=1 Tax=Nibricoccus aquaticus TaxID=2576891 RepID=A0A290Q6R6_9BACT|nr:cytochrome c [Nibricoccus aquaticus]ATC62870.1 cytochrome C [Nibricoccus aquaticus]